MSAPFDAAELRFQRDCERMHRLGARILWEMLREIASERMLRGYLEQKVAAYAALDPTAMAVLGADRFPPALFVVGGPQ